MLYSLMIVLSDYPQGYGILDMQITLWESDFDSIGVKAVPYLRQYRVCKRAYFISRFRF